ncbi:MAG: hypothetical protein GWP05_08740 [Anaerolineaceae bacterium]|nr:hypothetical protein [Anaerolineaceae bacterium]
MRPISVSIIFLCLLPAAGFALSAEATGDAKDSKAEASPPASGDESAGGDKTEKGARKKDGDRPASAESAPANPFTKTAAGRPDALAGAVELSDGTVLPGLVYLTRGKDLEIFDTAKKKQRRIPLASVLTIEAVVEWERMDRQWRFKTAGHPEKVYTGKSYPNRMLSYRITLGDQGVVEGHIAGQLLYVQPREGRVRLLVLHKRHKGPPGTKLKDLVYLKRVRLGEKARQEAEEQLRKKAEQEACKKKAKDTAGGQEEKSKPERKEAE